MLEKRGSLKGPGISAAGCLESSAPSHSQPHGSSSSPAQGKLQLLSHSHFSGSSVTLSLSHGKCLAWRKGKDVWIHWKHGMMVPWAVLFLVLRPRDTSSPQDPGENSAQPSQGTPLPEGCSSKATTARASGILTSSIWRTAGLLSSWNCLVFFLFPSSTLLFHFSFFCLSGEMFFALPP